jgi:hypothetical protein
MVPPGAGRQDTRVDATAGKPQLAQPGHATQEYRLHQPTFLDAERTRLLAANLGTGSPRALLYPGDPWAIIEAHRRMDADPTRATGAMGWAPGAGLALAGAVEQSVRASLPRVAAAGPSPRARRSCFASARR